MIVVSLGSDGMWDGWIEERRIMMQNEYDSPPPLHFTLHKKNIFVDKKDQKLNIMFGHNIDSGFSFRCRQ